MTDAVSLSRHLADIAGISQGQAMLGCGAIDILYACDPADRAALVADDVERLKGFGYRARVAGRNRQVIVELTNVGTAMNARYVK